MADDYNRGNGETTRQMQALPAGGLLIWCNDLLDYPRRLAHKIGRSDIRIESQLFLDSDRWRGTVFSGVAVDHAASLTWDEWFVVRRLSGGRQSEELWKS